MHKNKISKIVKDLQSDKEKTIILALMYIPRLEKDEYYQEERLVELKKLLNQFQSSSNPDISYLSQKARNFLSLNYTDQIKTNEPRLNSIESINSLTVAINPDTTANNSQGNKSLTLNSINSNNFSDFLNHTDYRMRAQAVEVCTKTLPYNQLPTILTPLLSDPNNRVRANVIVALKNTNPKLVSESLRDMLINPQIGMRESAIWAISKLNCNDLYQKLLMKALHDPYRDIRVRTIQALKAYKCNEVLVQMKRLSTDSDPLVSEKAKETLQFFDEYKTNVTGDITPIMPELNISNESFIPLNDDTNNSINIETNFLDISETSATTKATQKYSSNKNLDQSATDLENINGIARRIVLHQQLESLDVEDFFETNNSINDEKFNHTETDRKIVSPPNSEILSWIPNEYQPDKYKEINNTKDYVDKPHERNIIRGQISTLLIKVGRFQFNRLSKSQLQTKNPTVNQIVSTIRKMRSVKDYPDLGHDKKIAILKQLEKTSKEALISLGRATIKEHNSIEFKCGNLTRYQKDLKVLIDRLAKLNS